jgi:hypothetical protein
MFCPKCGTTIQDDANFCYKCGASITPQGKAEPSQYEVCQIEYEDKSSMGGLFGSTFIFWADAVGLKGNYSAASLTWNDRAIHTAYPDSGCNKCQQAHRQLIQQLVEDGWQPSEERGRGWWQLRFRRQIARQ